MASLQFAYRTLKGIAVIDADPIYQSLPGLGKPEGTFRCSAYSPCGRYFAWASADAVTVIEASTGSLLATLPTPAVYELAFSPQGSFVITWERPGKDGEGIAAKNLKVWSVSAASVDASRNEDECRKAVQTPIGSFVQRSQTGWNLQYTSNERYCARAVTNEIHFFESSDLTVVWNKLRAEGLSDFALSAGEKQSVAVFIPERKGQPAAVKVFNLPEFSHPVSQKNFFKGDKVQLKWNQAGTSLIVLAQTEVDKTGKSYYGETNLYLLSASGDVDVRVQLDKDGPIHDVMWSPKSNTFAVVYGYMPTKTTIFDTKAVATHHFPLAPRNTVRFSPNGQFVLLAGFGNLAGQIDVYDGDKGYRRVTTIESGNPSVCDWSPDSSFILTATTSPRLRVDNGVKIWHVSKGLMYNEDLTELYEVDWRPGSFGQDPSKDPLEYQPSPHHSAVAYLSKVKTPAKPAGAYRPPGARGQTTPLHFKREDEGGAAHVSNGVSSFYTKIAEFGKPKRREVPGAEAAPSALPPGAAPGGGVSLTTVPDPDEGPSKAALKNKRKREAKKAKEAAEKAASGAARVANDGIEGADGEDHVTNEAEAEHEPRHRSSHHQDHAEKSKAGVAAGGSGEPGSNKVGNVQGQPPVEHRHTSTSKIKVNAKADLPTTSDITNADVTGTIPGAGSPEQKKLRSLLKKVRAIDDLKMRLATGEKLEDTQMKKIETEAGVRQELDDIGWTG